MVSQAMIETITFFEVVTSTFLLDILGSVTHLLVATPRMLLHINGKFTKEKLKPSFVIKFYYFEKCYGLNHCLANHYGILI
jgi:hypothetical protein